MNKFLKLRVGKNWTLVSYVFEMKLLFTDYLICALNASEESYNTNVYDRAGWRDDMAINNGGDYWMVF